MIEVPVSTVAKPLTTTMLALSIRQPWAWLILNAGKDIENRDWPTRFRGRFLIHASKGMTRDEYRNGIDTLGEIKARKRA